MDKTTVYLEPGERQRLKQIAKRTGKKPATLVRQAIAEFTARHKSPRRRSAFVAAFDSGLSDLGTNAEQYLKGMGEDS